MPRVVFTHPVKDVNHWLSKHSERVDLFKDWATNVEHYSLAEGSNHVALTMEVHDMEAMKHALQTPELNAAKEAHGVLEPIELYVAP